MSNRLEPAPRIDEVYIQGANNMDKLNENRLLTGEHLFMDFYHDGYNPEEEGADVERFMESRDGQRAIEIAQDQLAKDLEWEARTASIVAKQARQDESDMILLQLVERLGYEISEGHIIKTHTEYAPNQTCQGYETEEICEANFENFMRLVESQMEQARQEMVEEIFRELDELFEAYADKFHIPTIRYNHLKQELKRKWGVK